MFKKIFFHSCFWKYTYEDTALSSFFVALKGEGSDENYGNSIGIVIKFEVSIVAEIALPA